MRNLLVLTVAVLLAQTTYAQSTSKTKKADKTTDELLEQTKEKNSSTNKMAQFGSLNSSLLNGVGFSAGAQIASLEGASGDSISAVGLGIRAFKEFKLQDNFYTTTSLGANFLNLDEDDAFDNSSAFDIKLSARDFGFSQKVGMAIESQGIEIKPFVEIGYYLGTFDTEVSGDGITATTGIDYGRLAFALGADVKLNNGLMPFVKFERSTLNFDDDAVNLASASSDDADLDNNVVTMGIGYQF